MNLQNILNRYCKECAENGDKCIQRANNKCLDRYLKIRQIVASDEIGKRIKIIAEIYYQTNPI
jgi:hypothetical protein